MAEGEMIGLPISPSKEPVTMPSGKKVPLLGLRPEEVELPSEELSKQAVELLNAVREALANIPEFQQEAAKAIWRQMANGHPVEIAFSSAEGAHFLVSGTNTSIDIVSSRDPLDDMGNEPHETWFGNGERVVEFSDSFPDSGWKRLQVLKGGQLGLLTKQSAEITFKSSDPNNRNDFNQYRNSQAALDAAKNFVNELNNGK